MNWIGNEYFGAHIPNDVLLSKLEGRQLNKPSNFTLREKQVHLYKVVEVWSAFLDCSIEQTEVLYGVVAKATLWSEKAKAAIEGEGPVVDLLVVTDVSHEEVLELVLFSMFFETELLFCMSLEKHWISTLLATQMCISGLHFITNDMDSEIIGDISKEWKALSLNEKIQLFLGDGEGDKKESTEVGY